MDGSGKSTQVKKLTNRLDENNQPWIYSREAGSTEAGLAMRDILLNQPFSKDLDNFTRICLFAASYREGLTKKILPALEEGKWVVSDRTNISSIVYQGAMEEFPEAIILNNEIKQPDLVIILDIDHASFVKRQEFKDRDHMENELVQDKDKFNFLRDKYISYARKYTNVVVIDARQHVDTIHEAIFHAIERSE
ncbi:PREDICTED: thymidylate kinase-like [Habropoda laboriosa]|nr:PREDICTED: thymidylate kinase-like [Habropoda laboriosa]